MIGYYIHHHGLGHLSRATSICAQLHLPVTALTSLNVPDPHPFAAVLKLPRDDEGTLVAEPTAYGAFHWAPHHDAGLMDRMRLIAQWVAETRPAAVVIDVSVEVATYVRLLGVPVIVVAGPGERTDAPHLLVYRLADHIVAAWPRELYEPSWLRSYADKTSYVGGISRFDGREPEQRENGSKPTVLVLVGAGGSDVTAATVKACAEAHPAFEWTALGVPGYPWTPDPWPAICTADVMVTHAGQNCIADLAAAERPAVVIPQPRPFDEQRAMASVLQRHRLAVTARSWPDLRAWPALLTHARASDPHRWRRWATRGAAARAADAIETAARRCAPGGEM